jgi:carbon storage regulator
MTIWLAVMSIFGIAAPMPVRRVLLGTVLRGTKRSQDHSDSGCDGNDPRATRLFKEVEMLVLSRKLNEKIVIDGEIVVTVARIDRNQVRLGIEAPGHVSVFREEICPQRRRVVERRGETLAVGP